MRRAALIATLLLAPTAGAAELLPEASLRLQAARYAPRDIDIRHEGWIGAGIGLVRFHRTIGYFDAGVETILGGERRAFEANQANYHLELGAVRRFSRGRELGAFFHHVSRHAQDRTKADAVDWNILGVRASAPFPEDFPVPGRATVGLGHTTQDSRVGYRWEATARVETDLLRRPWGAAYTSLSLRLVSAERTADFPRDGLADFQVEGGVRFSRGVRHLELFLAFDHRGDVRIEEPGSRDRAMLGFRLRLGRLSTAPVEAPVEPLATPPR